MSYQLPVDCLNEIFEYLEEDKATLYSCLLVDRLWCKISVRILWRDIWNYKSHYWKRSLKIDLSILRTLVSCLPNESKKLLHDNNIFISSPTSKPLLFNYVAFCKALSIYEVNMMIDRFFINNEQSIISLNSKDRNSLVANEIIKMFANQISSLKKLTYQTYYHGNLNISFPHFPGVRDLSELFCVSSLSSNFFCQLSQICLNLQSISISFCGNVSNELKKLISLQNNLKSLTLITFDGSWTNSIIPVLTKHSHTITKLKFYGYIRLYSSLSFVSLFSNLQELIFSFFDGIYFEDFKELQHVKFSNLQILKIAYQCPRSEYIMKFLENNGKNLKKFYTDVNDKNLSLSIADFCPNLKSLSIILNNDERDILKTIFVSCQYLESIKILCGNGYFGKYLSEKELLETIAEYSPNNFCELKLYNASNSYSSPENFESFFKSWENRTPKKLLSLIFIEDMYESDDNLCYYDNCISLKTLEMIEKYENLGTIKFETKSYNKVREEEEVDHNYK
jgi:hypothetical protein